MREMAEFAKDYGLLLATILLCLTTLWYAIATAKMARVMALEQDLRKRAILSFQPVIVRANGWTELNIEQELTNIGFSYVTVESAVSSWKRQFDPDFERTVGCDKPLPCQLAPGEHLQLRFTVPQADLICEHPCAFESAADLFVGRIVYSYSGLDARGLVKETSWPGGNIIRLDNSLQPPANRAAGSSQSG